METINVCFEHGSDVFDAYWGYVSGGGLAVKDSRLTPGQHVLLQVSIQSTGHLFKLEGNVARIDDSHCAYISLDGPQADRLFIAALAETPVDVRAQLGAEHTQLHVPAHMVRLSQQGCCLRLDATLLDNFAVGSEVLIDAPNFHADGCVVWATGQDRGVMFSFATPAAQAAVQDYVESL